jgi:hypothetical protein
MMRNGNNNAIAVLIILLPILFVGCAGIPGMPGHITETKSSFDKSVELSMEPAFVFRNNDGFSGSDLRLALFWRSTMKPGDIVLEAYVNGAHNFSTGKSLHFNVDSEIVSFTSIDQLTNIDFEPGVYSGVYIPAKNVSSKRYLITSKFLDRLLKAKDVRVKLDLHKTYVEGIFSDTTVSSAKQAFVKFSEKIKNHEK